MRKILDKMLANKLLAFWAPLVFATLIYLLFLFFASAEDKIELLIATPIATVFCFFGTFLVVFLQVKNPRCPEGFLNFFELLAAVMFTVFGVIEAISFIISGFQNFSPLICAGTVTYSSISLAHSKRIE